MKIYGGVETELHLFVEWLAPDSHTLLSGNEPWVTIGEGFG